MSTVRIKLIRIVLWGAFCVIISGGNALADGFTEKLVQIDGIASEGRLDNENNLEFLGLALWKKGIKLKFSPSVRARFALKPSVRTAGETGFWGHYRVNFTLAPKASNVSKNNLQVKVLGHRGAPIPDIGVLVTPGGSEWGVEVTWSKEDARGVFEVFVSYSAETQKSY